MTAMKPLTPERARELGEQLEAARKESEAIRVYLETRRRRCWLPWPDSQSPETADDAG
jgi:hypothetical protein